MITDKRKLVINKIFSKHKNHKTHTIFNHIGYNIVSCVLYINHAFFEEKNKFNSFLANARKSVSEKLTRTAKENEQ